MLEKNESQKIAIVTGAAGFLGSHLCERLISENFVVIGLDNFSTGSKENIDYLKKRFSAEKNTEPQFIFEEFDVVQPWGASKVLQKYFLENSEDRRGLGRLKYIFHMASPASPLLYQRLALETLHVNTVGLENALMWADRFSARVVFASTSEVYGDPEVNPQPESYWGHVNSYGERSCYDEAKRCGEAFLFSYNKRASEQGLIKKHGLVRIFNTYGPRMNPHDGRVVVNFLVQGLNGQKLTVYGDGSQTRSFCYVDDMIDGIYRYALSDLTQPVNLGNPKEFTILQLAQTVHDIFKSSREDVEFLPLPIDDPRVRRPDITLAMKLLNPWQPHTELQSGLLKMLDWLKTRQG